MNVRNDVSAKAIEVNIQSTRDTEEEFLYFLPEETLTVQQLWEEKEALRSAAKTESHNDPENEVSELQNFHKPTAGTVIYRERHFKGQRKIQIGPEQPRRVAQFASQNRGSRFC